MFLIYVIVLNHLLPFDLPKRTIRNNCSLNIFFKQTLNGVENLFGDIARYVISYDEFEKLCKKHEKAISIIFILIDLKRKTKEDIVFVMKTNPPTLNVLLKQIHSRFFKLTKCYIH